MNDIDVRKEWQNLEETYTQMADDELCSLAGQAYELTDIAKQALQAQISSRGLHVELREAPPDDFETGDEEEREEPDPAELDLIDATQVLDAEEARRVMQALHEAGIPAFLGPDNVADVDAFHSSFDNGVWIRVPEPVQRFASEALARAFPKTDRDAEEEKPYVARCPYCHSEDIVFEDLAATASATDSPPTQKYHWRCDNCGKEWEDDGLEDGAGQ